MNLNRDTPAVVPVDYEFKEYQQSACQTKTITVYRKGNYWWSFLHQKWLPK